MKSHGRVLGIKWGMNPNSSSLGVDVTFLLLGTTAVALFTPLVATWVRWRRFDGAAGDGNPADKSDG